MKNAFFALIALTLATPAFAGEQYYCQSNFGTKGKTLFVKSLSHERTVEGEKMSYLVVIRDGSETIFEGKVFAAAEDVMLKFWGRRDNQKLSGMIYMDELDQTWMNLDGIQMHFDCDYRQN